MMNIVFLLIYGVFICCWYVQYHQSDNINIICRQYTDLKHNSHYMKTLKKYFHLLHARYIKNMRLFLIEKRLCGSFAIATEKN